MRDYSQKFPLSWKTKCLFSLAVCCVASLGMASVTYLSLLDVKFQIDDECNWLEQEIRELDVEAKRLASERARMSSPANLETLREELGIKMVHVSAGLEIELKPGSRLATLLKEQEEKP